MRKGKARRRSMMKKWSTQAQMARKNRMKKMPKKICLALKDHARA